MFSSQKSAHFSDKKDGLVFFRNITAIKFKIVVSDLLWLSYEIDKVDFFVMRVIFHKQYIIV